MTTTILICPQGAKIPENFGLNVVTLPRFIEVARYDFQENDVLVTTPHAISVLGSIISEFELEVLAVLGCPGGDYSIAWAQATVNYATIGFEFMRERADVPGSVNDLEDKLKKTASHSTEAEPSKGRLSAESSVTKGLPNTTKVQGSKPRFNEESDEREEAVNEED